MPREAMILNCCIELKVKCFWFLLLKVVTQAFGLSVTYGLILIRALTYWIRFQHWTISFQAVFLMTDQHSFFHQCRNLFLHDFSYHTHFRHRSYPQFFPKVIS